MAVLQCKPSAALKLVSEWQSYLGTRTTTYKTFQTTADDLKKYWKDMGAVQFAAAVTKEMTEAAQRQKKIDEIISLVQAHAKATAAEHDKFALA